MRLRNMAFVCFLTFSPLASAADSAKPGDFAKQMDAVKEIRHQRLQDEYWYACFQPLTPGLSFGNVVYEVFSPDYAPVKKGVQSAGSQKIRTWMTAKMDLSFLGEDGFKPQLYQIDRVTEDRIDPNYLDFQFHVVKSKCAIEDANAYAFDKVGYESLGGGSYSVLRVNSSRPMDSELRHADGKATPIHCFTAADLALINVRYEALLKFSMQYGQSDRAQSEFETVQQAYFKESTRISFVKEQILNAKTAEQKSALEKQLRTLESDHAKTGEMLEQHRKLAGEENNLLMTYLDYMTRSSEILESQQIYLDDSEAEGIANWIFEHLRDRDR